MTSRHADRDVVFLHRCDRAAADRKRLDVADVRHRQVGTLSYVLVPLIVATTVHFLHFRLRNAVRVDAIALYFMALVLNALAAFLVIYGLAMYTRRQRPVHGGTPPRGTG